MPDIPKHAKAYLIHSWTEFIINFFDIKQQPSATKCKIIHITDYQPKEKMSLYLVKTNIISLAKVKIIFPS
jgi:hypothetical protein